MYWRNGGTYALEINVDSRTSHRNSERKTTEVRNISLRNYFRRTFTKPSRSCYLAPEQNFFKRFTHRSIRTLNVFSFFFATVKYKVKYCVYIPGDFFVTGLLKTLTYMCFISMNLVKNFRNHKILAPMYSCNWRYN